MWCNKGPELFVGAGSDEKFYYHQNNLYSVASLTDQSGAVVERYAYTAYGEPTFCDAAGTPLAQQPADGSPLGNPYLYTGRRFDAETKLFYYRARTYSPRLGRFLSRDPIGYKGDISLYEYVSDRPDRATDPTGLVDCNGGEWEFRGYCHGFSAILGYERCEIKFTCKRALHIGDTDWCCAGQNHFYEQRYKVPVAYGTVVTASIGPDIGITLLKYQIGQVWGKPTSDDLKSFGYFVLSFSGNLFYVGLGASGGPDSSAASPVVGDVGLGGGGSVGIPYTFWTSDGYELFDEPLSVSERRLMTGMQPCTKGRYKAFIEPKIDETPADFPRMPP